eukprot:7995235-Pyramimonas_sp.AAC.1
MMYENNTAQVAISSRRFDWIDSHSGVTQGCPASMYLFVLAVDPLLRWLSHRCALNISIHLACADDFCSAWSMLCGISALSYRHLCSWRRSPTFA